MDRRQFRRFKSKVRRIPRSCWEWIGYLNMDGYGMMRLGNRVEVAHRVSYKHFIADIPTGLEIDHLCRNRKCVNPKHLEPVTHKENMVRAMVTHCIRGHEYSDQNTYNHSSGRSCRQCNLEAVKKYKLKKVL